MLFEAYSGKVDFPRSRCFIVLTPNLCFRRLLFVGRPLLGPGDPGPVGRDGHLRGHQRDGPGFEAPLPR